MTENRFLLEDSDFDLKYEFRVADLSRVEKTKEDFWNEKIKGVTRMTKSSVDRKRSRYGEKYSLRFHKQLKIYNLSCDDEIPSLIAKFVETDGDLAMKLFERLESNYKENEQLKAQLYCDSEEGVCIICKHHYLEKGNLFYISKCEKGHEECSTDALKHCKDFEIKESKNE